MEFLRYGWPINYSTSETPPSNFGNHLSARRNSVYLETYLFKELDHHSIIGPFSYNQFTTKCVISPLVCVPKRDSDDWRVAHDLSFPKWYSVNDGIDKDSFLNETFELRLPEC